LVAKSVEEKLHVFDLVSNVKGSKDPIPEISLNKPLSNLVKNGSKFKLLEIGGCNYLLLVTDKHKLNLINLETRKIVTLLSDKVMSIESFDDSEICVFLENLKIKVWDVGSMTWKRKLIWNLDKVRDSIQDMISSCDTGDTQAFSVDNKEKKRIEKRWKYFKHHGKELMMNFPVKCADTVFKKLYGFELKLPCFESNKSKKREYFPNENSNSLFLEVQLNSHFPEYNGHEIILILRNPKYQDKKIILNLKIHKIFEIKPKTSIKKRTHNNQNGQEKMGLFLEHTGVFAGNKLNQDFIRTFDLRQSNH
jgi:CxxC motif-containing protein